MNSRGALVRCRISGDTLDSSAAVAITPRIQPAAAGTQRSRVRLRVVVIVIGRQSIRRVRRRAAYCTGPVWVSPGPRPGSSGNALASRKAS